MRQLRAFATFWYDFIVGDDWTIAVGVVIALAVTAALAQTHTAAWWALPTAVTGLLGLSLLRAARAAARHNTGSTPHTED